MDGHMLNEREIMDKDQKSLMKHSDNFESFEQRLEKEYQKAVKNGFKGTKEEYFQIKNYI